MLRHLAKTVKYKTSNNFYKLLGVKENSNFLQIKKNYLQKLKTSHPDAQEGNHVKFISLQNAFETLSDPVKRRIYDKQIGIINTEWENQPFNTSPEFQNEQIQRVLTGKTLKKAKYKSAYHNLNIRYKEQLHLRVQKKYFYACMLIPVSAFTIFWLIWQFGEMFLLNYKGNAKYVQKVSTKGKDLSIVVTQIR